MATPLKRKLKINGKTKWVSVDDDTEPLLYVLRNQLGLKGPKFGCGLAQCGACTVLVDGTITRSCVKKMNTLNDGASVATLDGLGSDKKPHPLQRAFIEQQAGQCAYCGNAMIMGALGFLQGRIDSGNRDVPSEDEIKQFLSGESDGSPLVYLCRCGSHLRIVRAIQQAAKEMR
jgi:aerobic-type carbon monoxide dehydrogenase small subunit (CoxS/CutS family)